MEQARIQAVTKNLYLATMMNIAISPLVTFPLYFSRALTVEGEGTQ